MKKRKGRRRRAEMRADSSSGGGVRGMSVRSRSVHQTLRTLTVMARRRRGKAS